MTGVERTGAEGHAGGPTAGRVAVRTPAPEVAGAAPIPPDELRALLHLRVLPGVGDVRLRALIRRAGSARAALDGPAAVLGQRAAAARSSSSVRERVERALDVIDRMRVQVIVEGDARYPDVLGHLHDPPYIFFARGRLELLDRPAVAIVGSRRHTRYGAGAARAIAGGLARAGVVIVSGLAHGIDGHAHRAALAGGTIAVLGCGPDVVFPHEHDELQARIASEGLLLSEFAPGEPPLAHNFPRRNRLIAALARGVVVVEAPRKSGALITVEHAIDLGREVFAVPGPIDRETSAGTNALLRDGAGIATGAADVLSELGIGGGDALAATAATADASNPAPPEDLGDRPLRVWRALAPDPLHVDVLARRCGLTPAEALGALLELELRGGVRQLPGTRFVRAD